MRLQLATMNFVSENWESLFLYIILTFFIFLSLKKYLKLIYSLNVPAFNANFMCLYFSMLHNVQKNKDISYRTYIYETLLGTSKLFEKEKAFLIWVFLRPIVIVSKAEAVEEVLSSNVLIEKAEEYRFLHPWLNTGLLTSGGEKWRTRRKLLTPSFHFRILEDFIPVFNEQSTTLIGKMKELSHKEWIDIIPLITMCTLDIICNSTMGVNINAQNNPESEYVKAIHIIGDQVIYRTARPWLWIDEVFYLFPSGRNYKKNLGIVHGFTRKVIKEKKKELLTGKKNNSLGGATESPAAQKQRRAFLEMLLEHHINDHILSEEDIREEVDTFMFEGHDTTAMAICWCLYCIGLYPKVQKKVYDEIEEIFADDKERQVTSDDIKSMKYLEFVFKESLRLFPPVPFIGRQCNQETTIGKYRVLPGCAIAVLPYVIHRDPAFFPNPEVFDPERFLPENSANRNPFAYVPFSGGPRNCIGQRFAGMEEKTVVANILRNFELESLDERDKIIITPDVILRPNGPLRLRVMPR